MDACTLPYRKAATVLAGRAELWQGCWPEHFDAVPVVVADSAMTGEPSLLLQHVEQGGRAVLCLPPTALRASALLGLPLHTALAVAGPNPLVAAAEATGHGYGPLDGVAVVFDQASVVPGAPVVSAAGHTLVGVVEMGAGELVVVGSAGVFADGLLGVAGNLDLLWWSVTGRRDTPALPAAQLTHIHPSPDVVTWGDHPPLPDLPATTRHAARMIRHLPAAVHDALCDFADEGHRSGGLLISGVPFGAVPVTPPTPTAPGAVHEPSQLVLLTVARVLGQPVGYLPEHGGDLTQNIVPVKASADRQVSTSSAVTLMWHTEAAFHPHRPRFLLLACLRGDAAAATLLSSIDTVVDHLPEDVRDVLSQPRFRTAADESYVGGPPTVLSDLQPVLQGSRHRPRLVFDADLMRGVDPAAVRALAALRAAIDACHGAVVLQAGDLLVVDNNRAVHGRSPFTPRFDGTDRWLQRTFVVPDLAACDEDRAGRIIATRFLP